MLSLLLLIYLVNSVSANAGNSEIVENEIMPICSDSPENMTFTPVEGYVGRYTAELCTKKNLVRKEWELLVEFYKTPDNCNNHSKSLRAGKTHSKNVEWVSSNHNCTDNQTVCMSAQFDLIFSACYSIGSRFINRSQHSDTTNNGIMNYFYFNVTNPYTEQDFHNNHALVDPIYHKDYMSVTWHPGIPPSVYKVELCLMNETNLNTCEPVSNCTTRNKISIKCYLNPQYGKYKISLTHIASWVQGVFGKQETASYVFWRNSTSVTAVSGSAGGAWAWAAAGVALAALAACALRRALAAGRRQKKLLRDLLGPRTAPPPADSKPACRHVLLLYAREGAAAARAVAALRAAIQQVIDGQVYDIFAVEVMALCAGAPAEWVRAMLQRPDVAVVLLQSPALHALHAPHMSDDGDVKLVSPLLGRAVAAREPAFGDALLRYALRMAGDSAARHDSYRKYYIATISDLPTEVLPCVVPYRRYALPAAAPLLLRDLAPRAPHAPHPADTPDPALLAALETFTRLLAEFVDYARENPDYLMEELMLIDT